MIDTSQIIDEALKIAVDGLFQDVANEKPSEINTSKAQLTFASELLQQYHKALQAELAQHGIDI